MRAREPDETGYARGVYWERFGDGEPTIVFVPSWAIVHSRIWKAQVPYFARRGRVLVFDPRGNGKSCRPQDPADYAEAEYAEDLLAVMDASTTERAVLVALSRGAQRSLLVADSHPDRVLGLVFVGPALTLAPPPERTRWQASFEDELDVHDGWAKWNAPYWRRHYRDFLEFFFGEALPEPHSTKQTEDAIGYALETDPDTLIATALAPPLDAETTRGLCARVRCPVLVIHGEDDRIRSIATGEQLAELTGGRLLRLPGVGHVPQARKPVLVNIAVREFVEGLGHSAPGLAHDSRSVASA
jgi:pimeloyl-ACP methyl ester carboxylesterase